MVYQPKQYEQMPIDILSRLYFYLLTQCNPRLHFSMKQQHIQLIERIANDRGLSSLELKIIGYWFIEKEKNLMKDENML